ncbi:translation initiation factor 2 [Caulobacter sp. 17J65-9]|uniref:translation initiation factor 2 n=1 Tax=Caulobacter sp. 17J65-9 TaxID=2709382 RepID=UPI0013CDC3FD|nr:translation initiation factor 2 [Caulobacter sp. 17J65-9]NEX93158.1 translation initiation factor 2 [Caulobacter sp. 17J65-9]
MKSVVRIAVAVAAAASLSACATVTRGTNTAWEVQTDPVGAQVTTSHGHQCPSTPCAIKMPRKSEFTATITKDGYETATVVVTNKIAGGGAAGMAGNVLVGGVIGAGVDVASGAMLDLTPNPAIVKLEPKKTVAAAPVAAPAPTAEAAPAPAAQPGA